MTEENLPTTYQPFERLSLFANSVENVRILFSLSGNVPLLLGRGEAPIIWINRPIIVFPETEPRSWVPFVDENRPLSSEISVIHPVPNQTIVAARGTILIDCVADDPRSVSVRSLDLRPLGLRVYGEADALIFGNQKFTQNVFKNIGVMLRIAGGTKPVPRRN